MSTLATPAPPALHARPPWRALAVLTLVVGAVHLLLLAMAPTAVAPAPSPLVNSFSTRTIVIAPPSPPAAAAPASPAGAAAPAATAPVARPARPRAAVRARPAAAVADTADKRGTPQRDAATATPESSALQDPLADAAAAVPSPMPAASASASAEAAAAADAGSTAAASDTTTAAAAGPAGGVGAPGASGGSGPPGASGAGAGGPRAGPVALQIPGSVRLLFTVTGQQGTSPMQGVFGELTWLQDGAAYDARLSLTLLFKTLRSQHSTGAIGATGIEPRRFADTRRSEVASHFVRERGEVVFSSNAPTVPLLAGAQDRLSVVMQLGGMLAGAPGRYPAGSTIAVQTVGPRDADVWTFQVDGEETLALPAGEVVARRLTRNPRRPYDDKVELWVAPSLGYLPVRIKQTQPNGDFADMQLREQAPVRPPG